MRSNRFHVSYRYQTRPNGSWTYTTRSADTSMWTGPRARSETAVASWLKSYHHATELLIDDLNWEGDDDDE